MHLDASIFRGFQLASNTTLSALFHGCEFVGLFSPILHPSLIYTTQWIVHLDMVYASVWEQPQQQQQHIPHALGVWYGIPYRKEDFCETDFEIVSKRSVISAECWIKFKYVHNQFSEGLFAADRMGICTRSFIFNIYCHLKNWIGFYSSVYVCVCVCSFFLCYSLLIFPTEFVT